ncbi:MAG: acyl--CoA ligase [Rhodospirillales bacterium]|nr:acyl--CoA ligase [Rhodospirillales bacterium]
MASKILSLLNGEALAEFHQQGHWRDETIYTIARRHADQSPDGYALRDQARRLTWRELIEAADAFAADMAGRGLVHGQRVAFWMPDRMESVVALLACSRNGLVCCPSPHRNHTAAEVVTLLERMRASVLIYQNGFGADGDQIDIEAEIGHLGSMRHVYRLMPLQPGDTTPPFEAVMNAAVDTSVCPAPVSDPDSVIYMAFTSGSTGVPKGVMHSDNTLLVTARGISTDWHIGIDSVVYSLSPFSHNLGIGSLLTAIYGGAEYVIHDIARADSLADRLLATDTSYLVGVPTHAIDLLAELRARNLPDLGRLTGFRISGAAVPGHVIADLHPFGIEAQSGYGMTETNGHQYTLPGDDLALIMDSSGKACPGYEIRIFDEEDHNVEVPVGQIGQLAGRGASLMLGYFDDQIATESCFNDIGWFMTGDLGWVDENGYLRLTGRKKEVIIRGGHNINPARIEELATLHDNVERAAVISIPDARLGERVCLAIMFRADAAVPVGQILDHLSESGLSRFDMPEYFLELPEIPLMSNGKIQKLDIVNWIRDGNVQPVAIRPDQSS